MDVRPISFDYDYSMYRSLLERSSASACVNATLRECVSGGAPEWWAALVWNSLNGDRCMRGASAACEYVGRLSTTTTSGSSESAPESQVLLQTPAGKLRYFYDYVGERGCLESLVDVHSVCAGERASVLFEGRAGGADGGLTASEAADDTSNTFFSDTITRDWSDAIDPAELSLSTSVGGELDHDARVLLSLFENETLAICLCVVLSLTTCVNNLLILLYY